MDLFSIKKRIVVHKKTGVSIIAIRDYWMNGVQHVECLVPQTDDGKKWYFCNACYSIDEVQL